MPRTSVTSVKRRALRSVVDVGSRTPLRRFVLHSYDYMHSPAQLCHLVGCVTETASVPGALVEIGCAYGATTVLLNRHLDDLGVEKDYVCVDTFSGFTEDDIAAEHEMGNFSDLSTFRTNERAWFERTMALNRVRRVTVVQGDISDVDVPADSISFCLIDVDLYRPVLAGLERVWDRMSEGGIVVVDDCDGRGGFRNAVRAYTEFAATVGLDTDVRAGKHGVLRKPAP